MCKTVLRRLIFDANAKRVFREYVCIDWANGDE
jgi:hypothetical protein